MLAVIARFARWIPAIDFDEGSSVPLAFIFQLTDKLTPSDITDGFCQTVIFDHVLDGQTLDANHLVFVYDASRKFVLVVTPTVIDTSMNTGHLAASFLPVLGTFLFLGMPTLGFCQFLLITGIELGVPDSLTCGEDHHRFQAQVKTNLGSGEREWLNLFLKEYGDKVAIGTVLGDGDRAWFEICGECTVEGDGKRLIHFGKGELTIRGEAEGCPNVGGRLRVAPFLERGILGTSLKEVLVGTVQVTKGLLQWNSRNISKPRVLLLQVGQHGREVVIGQLLPMLEVGSFAGGKPPVVDEAATSERLRKDTLLLIGWVESILVCSLRLAHWFAPFLNIDISYHIFAHMSINKYSYYKTDK